MGKKVFASILIVISILFSAGAIILASELSLITKDNSRTSVNKEYTESVDIISSISEGFEKITESDSFELYLNKSTLGLEIKDKSSGFIYSSKHNEIDGLNENWINFMYSGLTIEYMDANQKLIRLPVTMAKAQLKLNLFDHGFESIISFPEEGFSLTLIVELIGDSLTVSVPEESIIETSDVNKLQNIYLYPMFGATKGNDVPGYFFVPDGSGALIRTDEKDRNVSAPYIKRIYGDDLGIGNFITLDSNNMLYDAERIHMPIYGVVYSDRKQGYSVIIEEGDIYSELQAYLSGMTTPYNFITTKFILRETYKQAINQAGGTMIANQSTKNDIGIKLRMKFLSGNNASYVGMAKDYQDYLIQNNILHKKENTSDEVPLKVEFLGTELQSELIGHSTKVMTTVKDMDHILQELLNEGITNIKAVLNGVSNDGASASMPTDIALNSRLGSKKEWDSFLEKYKNLGVDISMYVDYARGYEKVDGYNSKKDAAQAVNKALLKLYKNGRFTYLGPEYIKSKFNTEGKALSKYPIDGIAIDTIGYELYSNWNQKGKTTRKESKEILTNLTMEGILNAYYSPNSYMWKNAEEIYNIPMSSSGYLIFTDTVPFMQMVLKGYIPYYSTASNFYADTTSDILKSIEYGANVTYYLTMEDSIELFNTPSSWLFTSKYEVWKNQIVEEYNLVNNVLSKVMGESIIDHKVLADGVVAVDYTNNIEIIINYNNTDYDNGDFVVKAQNFIVTTLEQGGIE